MKQEDARTKWCPMSRVIVSVGNIANRVPEVLIETAVGDELEYFKAQKANCNCLASDCMLWQWLSKEDGLGYCGLGRV